MLTEKEIKDKITKEANSYQIKTTSKDILSKYQKQKENDLIKKVKPFYLRSSFISAVSFCILAVIVIPTSIYFSNKNTRSSQNEVLIPTNNKTIKMASYELFAGINYLDLNSPVSLIKKQNQKVNYNDFQEAVKDFDTFYPLINNIVNYDSNYTPFNSEDQNYPYAIKINNFEFYYASQLENNKDKVQGYLKDKNNSYYVEIEKEEEQEDDELEIETKTKIYQSSKKSSNYILIEKNLENEDNQIEAEYSLTDYRNSKIYTKLIFELESDEKEFTIETKNEIEEEQKYLITNETSNILNLNYQNEENEIIINNIKYDKDSKIYSYLDFTYKSNN